MNLADVVRRALEEDRASDDVTTAATVPSGVRGTAVLVAKESCVVSGLDAFAETFRIAASMRTADVDVALIVSDGVRLDAGSTAARVTGELASILAAERTALNFVRHLSGIATTTARFVAAAGGVPVRDTRKTTPGLRALEKAAVRAGGGTNHRPDLAAAILIKDNHIVASGGIDVAIKAAKTTGLRVEVECDTLDQVRAALEAGADELLLDNMAPEVMREAVALARGRAQTEASGNVTLDTIPDIASTGVDSISVGALTHSAPSADLSLEVEAE